MYIPGFRRSWLYNRSDHPGGWWLDNVVKIKEEIMDVKAKVIELIVEELGVEVGEVTLEASFIEDLGADSLDTVELIMKFEEEFDIDIADDDAEGLTTVGKAIEYLEKQLN
jgi:acyl carrier protein